MSVSSASLPGSASLKMPLCPALLLLQVACSPFSKAMRGIEGYGQNIAVSLFQPFLITLFLCSGMGPLQVTAHLRMCLLLQENLHLLWPCCLFSFSMFSSFPLCLPCACFPFQLGWWVMGSPMFWCGFVLEPSRTWRVLQWAASGLSHRGHPDIPPTSLTQQLATYTQCMWFAWKFAIVH